MQRSVDYMSFLKQEESNKMQNIEFIKRFIAVVLIFSFLFPAYSFASQEEILKKIEALTKELQKMDELKKELESLKKQVEDIKKKDTAQEKKIKDVEKLAKKAEGISRFELWGEYRFKLDSIHAKFDRFTGFRWNSNVTMGGASVGAFQPRQYGEFTAHDDTLLTNRLRLKMKVKATEDVDFTGRLAMYKIWGQQTPAPLETNYAEVYGFMPQNATLFDGNTTYRPADSALRVDRAFMNWYEPWGLPGIISVGRRPSAGGPPLHLRQGIERDATPAGLGVDYAMDGLAVIYTPDIEALPGLKARLCFGKGFESGLRDNNINTLKDATFAGFNFDIYEDREKGTLAQFQIFRAFNINDLPEEATANIGDIDHITALYMTRTAGVDWFVSAGLSRTHPNGVSNWRPRVDMNADGDFDDPGDRTMSPGGLLYDEGGNKKGRTGHALYAGLRVPYGRSKFGLEYNYGSKYWLSFTPSADDIYGSKLATRGHVGEAYWIYDLTKKPVWKVSKVLFRLGYQHYVFNYSGSGIFLGEPKKLSGSPTLLYPSPRIMDNVYASFDVHF